jgi:hypothetical protein
MGQAAFIPAERGMLGPWVSVDLEESSMAAPHEAAGATGAHTPSLRKK